MGTNIYMCRIPTEEEINKLHALIDQCDFDGLRDQLDTINTRIHIGKKSYGWKFLFQIHPHYYGPTKKSIMDFLNLTKSGQWELKDEYGDDVPLDTFWNDYVDVSKDGYDSLSYTDPIIYQYESISPEGFRYTYQKFS